MQARLTCVIRHRARRGLQLDNAATGSSFSGTKAAGRRTDAIRADFLLNCNGERVVSGCYKCPLNRVIMGARRIFLQGCKIINN
jgi:hypothetical protein